MRHRASLRLLARRILAVDGRAMLTWMRRTGPVIILALAVRTIRAITAAEVATGLLVVGLVSALGLLEPD